VIVNDFDLIRSILPPRKTDAKLIIDTDAVLALSVSSERLQIIAWWNSQIGQSDSCFNLIQLPERHALNVSPPSGIPPDKELERVAIFEVLDHAELEYNAYHYM
jgi:hypothetical protein